MFWLTARRRKKIASRPFPPAWLEILQRNVPYYRCLIAEDQRELQQHIKIFLAEKRFEGLGDPPVQITGVHRPISSDTSKHVAALSTLRCASSAFRAASAGVRASTKICQLTRYSVMCRSSPRRGATAT